MASTLEVLFMLLLIKVTSCITGPMEVTGGVGETVQISCQYAQFYRDKVKYWCRGYHWYFCTVVVRSDRPQNPAQSVLLSDNKALGEFTVHMHRVREEDSDWYWCAIETASRGVGVRVKLQVSKWHVSQLPTTTTSGEFIETTSPWPSTSSSSSSHHKTSSAATATHFLLLRNSTNSPTTSGLSQLDDTVWRVWGILRWVLVLGLFLVAMIGALRRRRLCHQNVECPDTIQ